MTKRDIADIVLVWFALTFILRVMGALVTVGTLLLRPDNDFMNKGVAIPLQLIYLFALLTCAWLLLFRRDPILTYLFPGSAQQSLDPSRDFGRLTDYAFWVKFIGLFVFLTSGIEFISHFGMALAARQEDTMSTFWWMRSGPRLVSAVLGAVVIWKSKSIATLVERAGGSNTGPDAGRDNASGPAS